MNHEQIQKQLQESLGNFKGSMKTLQSEMMAMMENVKKDLSEDELKIIQSFEKEAVNADINNLSLLREKYMKKIKDGAK